MRRLLPAAVIGLLATCVLALPPAAAGASAAGTPKPFGKLPCHEEYGIRLCAGGMNVGGKDLRIPSFDGVPLDADVALPATGKGPFPLIVLLHGLGQSKTLWENKTNDDGIDDVTLADRGYAVLMYTARGFGDSCGTPASRAGTPACKKGWIQLADQRYEIRDTQYLAGMLADEGIAKPNIAVSGISYGGGQSLELAMMKNRMRLVTGKFVPFVSPKRHIRMSVAAAYAMWPWDDLVTALGPNGHLNDTTASPIATDLDPAGIVKESWVKLLYGVTNDFYLAPPGTDPQSDLTTWYNEIMAGEPYSKAAIQNLDIIQDDKSAIGIPMPAGGPAPTAIQSGWTDTLFPVSEALHYANRIKAAKEPTPLLLMFDDDGHGWAQNKSADVTSTNKHGLAFLDSIMLTHTKPKTGVITMAQTCPSTAPSGRPAQGSSLSALQHGRLRISGAAAQTITSGGGNPTVAANLDAAYSSKLCDSLPGTLEPGTAVYKKALTTGSFSLLGAPLIAAHLHVVGTYPELVGLLWDVAPNGTRQIVALGAYRPAVNQAKGTTATSTGTVTMRLDLNPNDYTFTKGDTVELELVGSTAPLFRASNGTYTITATNVTVTLPKG